MNNDTDPLLESLFDSADREFTDGEFTSSVMANVNARRRRVFAGRLGIVAVLVALEVLLESPLQHTLGSVTEVLSTSLYPIDHEWLAFLLAPVNSVAGLLGMLLIGLNYLYRKIAR